MRWGISVPDTAGTSRIARVGVTIRHSRARSSDKDKGEQPNPPFARRGREQTGDEQKECALMESLSYTAQRETRLAAGNA